MTFAQRSSRAFRHCRAFSSLRSYRPPPATHTVLSHLYCQYHSISLLSTGMDAVVNSEEPPFLASPPSASEVSKPNETRLQLFHFDESRWKFIMETLGDPIKNAEELISVIRALKGPQSDAKLRLWQRDGVASNEDLWSKAIPAMQELILALPDLFPEPLQLLPAGSPATMKLSKKQVSALLSCSAFGLFDEAFEKRPPSEVWPTFDITALFERKSGPMAEFGLCLINYFQRIAAKGRIPPPSLIPEGFVYIERKVLNEKSIPDFANSKKPIASVTLSDKYIEHHLEYALHADFANKHIGGGVLRGGLVQEEILFVIKPECLISRLLCETMNPNEVIIIAGAEQFSLYKGYGRTVTFAGNFIDETPRNEVLDCVDNHIVAIDAIVSRDRTLQWLPEAVDRDIVKCYVGLAGFNKIQEERRIFVTGHWGCGAFGGDKELKAVQQLIACSEAEVDTVYCTFGDALFADGFSRVLEKLRGSNVTVGELYLKLKSYDSSTNSSLFSFIMDGFK